MHTLTRVKINTLKIDAFFTVNGQRHDAHMYVYVYMYIYMLYVHIYVICTYVDTHTHTHKLSKKGDLKSFRRE